MAKDLESIACEPLAITRDGFNPRAVIPYGCTTEHIRRAMDDFLEFLGFVNQQLATRKLLRLESFLMPANFSSMVGEFMTAAIPKYCPRLVKNCYHNGHPDMLPKGKFPGDSVLHATEGIEVKASRHSRGWQGHNAENVWLMVFVFDANSAGLRTRDCPEALSLREGGRGAAQREGLGIFRQVGNQPTNDHGQRDPHGVREDGSQLGLPR